VGQRSSRNVVPAYQVISKESDIGMAASVKDVAALAGVSVGTVSNVINRPDKVSASAASRVHAAIDQLGFVRNDAARQLRAGRSSTIGLVVLDVRNPFFTDLARAAEDRAANDGFSLMLGNSDERADREAVYIDLFEVQRVHGVLISPLGDITARLGQLRERGIPVVLVDRTSVDGSCSSVSVDDVAGGALAAGHLLEQGRRRLAFIGGPLNIQQVSDRLTGAATAVAAVPDATLEIILIEGLSALAGRAAGAELVAREPSDRPDAVFAVNDLVAMGVLQALLMQGGATTISTSPVQPSSPSHRSDSRVLSSGRPQSRSFSRRRPTRHSHRGRSSFSLHWSFEKVVFKAQRGSHTC
jgi:LacI family transcriptional regulator